MSGTTHDGGRVTTRPIGRIQATDLTSQMDPAKAFDGTVQTARARDLHDARDAFHTKQRFIQTRTTGTIVGCPVQL